MSIISDALKKVEGNSTAVPAEAPVEAEAGGDTVPARPPPSTVTPTGAPPVGREAALPKSTTPLFSVWSVLLSTIMVLIAAVLLLATWYTNRSQVTPPPAGPKKVVADVPPSPLHPPAALPAKPEVSPVAAIPVSVPAVGAKAPAAVTGEEETPGGPPIEAPKPTAPAEAPVQIPRARPRRDELELTGVVYTPQTRMAHINGKILSEGAEIAGYKVIRISRDSVRVSKDGKFFILKPQH